MAHFHRTKTKALPKGAHLNWMGGPSFDISDPLLRLGIAASSCFFGEPMYYHRDASDTRSVKAARVYRKRLTDAEVDHLRSTLDALDPQSWRGLSPSELMERAIDDALDHDAERTLAEAVRLRRDEYIRTTPQVILVRAAHHPKVKGTGLVRRFAKEIIRRADEPAVGLAYQMFRYGKPVPNALKKAWRDALMRFDAYQLAKYRMERRVIKTVDVMNLVHPKSEVIDQLAKGTLKNTGATWEALLSEKGASKDTWLEALEVMGHMALLRNLRNLLKAGVDASAFTDKLVAGAATGKQLPFRYYSAHRVLKNAGIDVPGSVFDAVEQCMVTSLGNLPRFEGRVMSLCDNSGSARGTMTSSMGTMQVASIANLTAVLTGMVSDEGWVGVFGDRLETFAVRSRASIFDQVDEADRRGHGIGGGTENGVWLFWDKAIRERQHWDSVFVYSDMQAGHGGLYGTDAKKYRDFKWMGGHCIDVPKLISAYRAKVNPNVQVFLVQVAGYQDTIVPEIYDKTYILGGWGDGLLRWAASMVSTIR